MESTRDRILAVARHLFGEQGYDGTSLRQIAERLGFSKAALYHHFQSKDQILEALVQPLLALQVEVVQRLERVETLEQWAEVLEWMIDKLLDKGDMFRLLDRNRATVLSVQERADAFGSGVTFTDALGDAVNRLGHTTGHKVRLASTLSAVIGFESVAPEVIVAGDRAELHAELVAMTRTMLGLPVSRRGARTRAASRS